MDLSVSTRIVESGLVMAEEYLKVINCIIILGLAIEDVVPAGICDEEAVPLLLVELKLWYGCGLDRVSFFR